MADNFPFKRVIILGASGFLGRALHRSLSGEGISVEAYGSANLDLRNGDMLEKLDGKADRDAALVFASALTPRRGVTLENLNANISMCSNTARYLERHPVGLCVSVSSDAVYPFSANPVREESPVEPANLYALAKYAGERIFHHVAATNGMPLLVVRPTALYGAGDTSNSYGPNQFMRSLIEKRELRLFGGGEEQRDHLYVEDAARLIRLLIGVRATGTFNLASGRSCSFANVAEELCKIVPFPFETVSLPRKSAITHRHFDVAQLFLRAPDFGFTPLHDGLSAYYKELTGGQA